MYTVNLNVGEFHLIFGALQDKQIANENVMESLIVYNYPEVSKISNQEKYDSLDKKNKEIESLMTRLYDETNDQLAVATKKIKNMEE